MHINSDTSTHEAFYTINNTVCRKYFGIRANNYLEEKECSKIKWTLIPVTGYFG